MDVSTHFQSDLEEIAEMVTSLDISDDFRTFADNLGRIKAKLDNLVHIKSNLEKLEKAFQTGQI